ncbi:hypothetical protein V6N12_044197 [Hibiscus sabdariffa]|uniref:Glyoxylate/hydroxypyruvate reductase HPR3 n=1 Tax=Hibiscus sabdariffa TaxID=183260 RepID=A0ABR2DHK0_9ROSI
MATFGAAELPLVLVHRPPNFHFPFKHRLQTHFRLLDPLDSDPPESTHSFFSRHSASIRVLLCVDPTPITRDLLSLLPFLQLIVGSSAGVDHIDLDECRRRDIAVTNSGKAFSPDVADLAVALLIDVLRRVSAGFQYVQAGLWPRNGEFPLGFKVELWTSTVCCQCQLVSFVGKPRWLSSNQLRGKRVGIVGLGSIGAEIAKRLESFGCVISYNSRMKKPSVPFPWYTNVYDLAVNSDVLVVCCALTEETRHMISKDVMTALGKEGVIINVGRGALIDEKELVQLLVRGELRGAGLDVFENEPDVPRELFSLDNVVLSPHCAVATPECFDALEELITANLKAFFSNKLLQSVVEF